MIIAYIWYMQGNNSWAIRDIATKTTIYVDVVYVSHGYTINNGRQLRLPVNHALAVSEYSLECDVPPIAVLKPRF